jgi:hypothetical protein
MDQDPAISVIDLIDANKKLYFLLLFEGTHYTHNFSKKKSHKEDTKQ